MFKKPCSATMSCAYKARLFSTMALWRIEKLLVSEIREHLRAAGLPLTGNKRALAEPLYDTWRARSLSSTEDEASSSHSRESQDEQFPFWDADNGSPPPDLTRRHHSMRHGRSRPSPGRRWWSGNSRRSRSTSDSTTTASGSATSSGGSKSSHSSSTGVPTASTLLILPAGPPDHSLPSPGG